MRAFIRDLPKAHAAYLRPRRAAETNPGPSRPAVSLKREPQIGYGVVDVAHSTPQSMASLRSYHSKRDFAVSREPRGKRIARRNKYRFVIQRHAATRLHYDLRLELNGVYKSWAVTKTPSLDPA